MSRIDITEPRRLALTAAIGRTDLAYAAWSALRDSIPLDDLVDPEIIGLLPLIWSNSVTAYPDDPDAARLRGVHHHRWVAANTCARDLVDGVERLDRAGIEARLGGGLAIAARAYPDLATRPLGDSVVLVPEARLPDAVAILRAADHRVDPPGEVRPWPTRRPIRWRLPGGTAITLAARANPWFAGPSNRTGTIDPGTIDIAGRMVPVTAPEELLIAALSGAPTTITPSSLLWIVDAVRLTNAGLIDPEAVLEIIERERLAAVVGPRLRFLAETVDIGIDAGLVDAIAHLSTTRRDRWLASVAGSTIRSHGLLRHSRRAVLRGLVTGRRLPVSTLITAAPRYFR